MTTALLYVPTLVLVAVLVVSGVAKLRSPEGSAEAFMSLRMPRWLLPWAPALLPWGELVLALALLVLPGWLNVAACVAATLLMLAYLVVIVRALGFDEPVSCHCFGDLGLGSVDRRTVARNAILSTMGVLAVIAALADPRSGATRLIQASADTWWWLLLLLLSSVLTVLIVSPGAPSAAATATAVVDGDEGVEGDYQRRPTPYVALKTSDGSTVYVREEARQQARLLVFVSLTCGSCVPILEQIPQWILDLAPLVDVRPVMFGAPRTGEQLASTAVYASVPREMLDRVWFDEDVSVGRLLECHGTPSAVLFGSDDLLAGGPVVGPDAVVELVQDIKEELAEPLAAAEGAVAPST